MTANLPHRHLQTSLTRTLLCISVHNHIDSLTTAHLPVSATPVYFQLLGSSSSHPAQLVDGYASGFVCLQSTRRISQLIFADDACTLVIDRIEFFSSHRVSLSPRRKLC